MLDVYNDAWEKNWGFVPMTPNEFLHTSKLLKSVVQPNFIQFVEVEDDVAGFIMVLPDFNQVMKEIPTGTLLPWGIFKILNKKKYISRSRAILLGAKAKYRSLGLGSIMYQKLYEETKKHPEYTAVELSWILEDNHDMNSILIKMGADPYKKYRIYDKELQ